MRYSLGPLLLAAALLLLPGSADAGSIHGSTTLVVSDDTDFRKVDFGNEYTGVGSVFVNYSDGTSAFCTGTLLKGGNAVLSAAHCFVPRPAVGGGIATVTDITAVFRTEFDAVNAIYGFDIIPVTTANNHPSYVGANFYDPYDLSILELSRTADPRVEQYGIYTGSDEIGQVGTRVGYGATGVGVNQFTDGFERKGNQVWETTSDLILNVPGADTILIYDFDNGNPANDALGVVFGLHDLGLGTAESSTGPGDSGGPTFLGGRVAGVTSFGFTFGPGGGDVDAFYNNSWGELGGDTRVSAFAGWIASFAPSAVVPLPASLPLLAAGLGLVGILRRRRAS